ncbi:MAG: tRNA (guanosine(37)-N1)-methyltransferase TrmD [Bacteroidia bacterium]
MEMHILTVVPDLLTSPFNHSILKRAQDKGLVKLVIHNIRDYSSDKYKSVDDYAFGGGAGMVMMIDPIMRCLEKISEEAPLEEVIYMTPDGERFNQRAANQLSTQKRIAILCGHYKGVDDRLRQHVVTREISIGDYVLSGGELAAAVIADSVIRLLPGVLNDETSALTDSFQDDLLAPPVFTRPAEYRGWKVPDVLLSGHSGKIEQWRHEQSLKRTKERRPDLLNED